MLRYWRNIAESGQNMAESGQNTADCGHVTEGLYIASSGAPVPPFSFSLALDPRL